MKCQFNTCKLHDTAWRHITLYYIILYYIILYYIILYYIILYYIILYYIILYYTLLYYIILYYNILYYIPLISRVPYGKLWTEFFLSFYGPSAKRVGHENKEEKIEFLVTQSGRKDRTRFCRDDRFASDARIIWNNRKSGSIWSSRSLDKTFWQKRSLRQTRAYGNQA